MIEETPGAPNVDAAADFAMVEERLAPVFELIGKRLADLEEDLGELRDVVYKIVSGFGDAVTEHRRGTMSEMLRSKYGPDVDELDGIYPDVYGKKFSDDILERLMAGEVSEDVLPDYIGQIKGRFSKIRGPAVSGEVVQPPPPEPSVEIEVGESEEEPAEEEEKVGGQGGDILASMTKVLKGGPEMLRGRRK